MYKIYPLLLLLFIACSPKLVYVGSSYQQKDSVAVFVDEAAITKPYMVMGVIQPEYFGTVQGLNYDAVIAEKAIKTAKEKGADAILFSNYYLKNEGASRNRQSTTIYTDGSVQRQSTSTETLPPSATGKQILLIKYKHAG